MVLIVYSSVLKSANIGKRSDMFYFLNTLHTPCTTVLEQIKEFCYSLTKIYHWMVVRLCLAAVDQRGINSCLSALSTV